MSAPESQWCGKSVTVLQSSTRRGSKPARALRRSGGPAPGSEPVLNRSAPATAPAHRPQRHQRAGTRGARGRMGSIVCEPLRECVWDGACAPAHSRAEHCAGLWSWSGARARARVRGTRGRVRSLCACTGVCAGTERARARACV